jgi:hypothetical protein
VHRKLASNAVIGILGCDLIVILLSKGSTSCTLHWQTCLLFAVVATRETLIKTSLSTGI